MPGGEIQSIPRLKRLCCSARSICLCWMRSARNTAPMASRSFLFDVLNRRYRDMRPTILLTNLGKAGMKAFLGARSFDRLREGGIWVPFDWESYRGKEAA